MSKKHILVVDNEEHLANSITYALRMANYDVSTARNGKDAYNLINLSRESNLAIDLIITDLWMPILTGVELLRELKNKKYGIPALIITATEDKKVREELLQLGCSTFIKKPFNDKMLLDKIQIILSSPTCEEVD